MTSQSLHNAPSFRVKCRRHFKALGMMMLGLGLALISLAQTPYADFVNVPAVSAVAFDDEFSVTIRVDIDGDPVSVAEVHLNFDPAFLEVLSLVPAPIGAGQPMELVIVPAAFDNNAGTIDYGVFRLFGPFPTASFDLLTINFKAKATTPAIQVTHELAGFPASLIAYGGLDVLDVANPFDLTIQCQGDPDSGDTDGDGLCDDIDPDDDNDGCPDDIDPAPKVFSPDQDGDGYGSDCDCDDNNPDVNPGADEVCDGIDNNCNGLIDAEDPTLVGQSPPVFDCNSLAVISLPTDPTACSNDTDITPPVADDDCGGMVTATGVRSDNLPLNDPWPLGATAITWTFTDPAGLSLVCAQTQNVIVNDATPPVITCAASGTRDTDAGQFSYTVLGTEFDPVSADDNCGVQSVTHNYGGGGTTLDGFVFGPGTTTVTWTVADINGESTTCDVAITVEAEQLLNGSIGIAAACEGKMLTVKAYAAGTSDLLYDITTSVDANGNFSVDDIVPGSYDIFVKTDGFLQKGLFDETVSAGTTALAFGTLLAGDINGDNIVDGTDLSALIAAYNSTMGNMNYNPTVDFNCNGIVDGVDLSLLISNYNLPGDSPNP